MTKRENAGVETKQKNCCDGCLAGMPIKRGMHRDGDKTWPHMVCQKHRYVKPTECAGD